MEITPALIEEVTRIVSEALKGGTHLAPFEEGPRALFLGGDPGVRQGVNGVSIRYEQDYREDQNIQLYDFLLLEQVTNAQLADIALGRDDTPLTQSVSRALLTEVPVYILADAFSYCQYATCQNGGLYKLLEQYRKTLFAFGIKETTREEIVALVKKQPMMMKEETSGFDFGPGVLTAGDAVDLSKTCTTGLLRFAKGTILTPSAKDVFRGKNIQTQS